MDCIYFRIFVSQRTLMLGSKNRIFKLTYV